MGRVAPIFMATQSTKIEKEDIMQPMTKDPTPLSKAKDIVGLNNHAVTLLRNGCLIGALDILCKARNCLDDTTPPAPPQTTLLNTRRPLHIVESDDDDGIVRNNEQNNDINRSSTRRTRSASTSCFHRQNQHRYEWVDCAQGVCGLQDADPTRDNYCSWGCAATETSSLFLCLHAIKIYETGNSNMGNDDVLDRFYGIGWAICYK